MTPEEDPYWPECREHKAKHWCPEAISIMRQGEDAIATGVRVCVPIPTHDPEAPYYAEVAIGPDNEALIPGISWPIWLVKTSLNPFSDEESLESIGLISLGETRFSLSVTIADWATGEAGDGRCGRSGHGFAQEHALQQASAAADITRSNNWLLATKGHCLGCEMLTRQPAQEDFGMGGIVSDRTTGSQSRYSDRNAATQSALQQRFRR